MKLVTNNKMFWPSIFDEIFPENKLDISNYENFSIPKVNISENLSTFVIELAVPGLKKENIAIEIEDEVLKVSSKITSEKESTDTKENTQFTRKEFNFESFSRSFTLPETVVTEEINATYESGVLKITIPKKEEVENIKRMVEIS